MLRKLILAAGIGLALIAPAYAAPLSLNCRVKYFLRRWSKRSSLSM